MKKRFGILFSIIIILFAAGCGGSDTTPGIKIPESLKGNELYKRLVDAYTQETGKAVNTVALDDESLIADILSGDFSTAIVYDSEELYKIVRQGGFSPTGLFYDTLVLIGPESDPVGAKQLTEYPISRVLEHISKTATFVHAPNNTELGARELDIWNNAGILPEGLWYIYAPDSETELLKKVFETQSYALMDRKVFEKYKSEYPEITIIQSGLKGMVEQYCLILNGSNEFAEWLNGESAQNAISGYTDPDGVPYYIAGSAYPLPTPLPESTPDASAAQ